jgi:hypothetical protein
LVVGGGRAAEFPKLKAGDVALNIDPEALPDVQGDVSRLPFRDSAFGEVYFEKMRYDTFTERSIRSLEEAARVLAASGRLIIETGIQAPIAEITAALRKLGLTYVRVSAHRFLRITGRKGAS